MKDPNMTDISAKIKELEQRKFTCDWSMVSVIQCRIADYKAKLSRGINFEPAF